MLQKPKSLIDKKSFELAMMAVSYSKVLRYSKDFEMASQLLRSGTSVMANVLESRYAESKKDFLHKRQIALKEASELSGWIQLCQEHPSLPDPPEEFAILCKENLSILLAALRTMRTNK